jgi:hypothetical protein
LLRNSATCQVFIIKTAPIGKSYLDNFTFDLFLPDHLWTFRENSVFNSPELEHLPKPKDKRDDNKDSYYCEKTQNHENIDSIDGNIPAYT